MNTRARLLADESLRGPIIGGLRRHHAGIDLVVAVETGLESWPDPDVLAWAAEHRQVVVAEDKQTMIGFANRRLEQGLAFPGLIFVPQTLPVGQAIRDIAALVERSESRPLDGRIEYLPLDKTWRVSDQFVECDETYAVRC